MRRERTSLEPACLQRNCLQRTCQCRAFKAGVRLLIGLAAGCLMPNLLQCLRTGEASAQSANISLPKTSPLPPRRPSDLGSRPATPLERPPGDRVPAPTGGPAADISAPGAGADSPPDVLLDREAIRNCGSQWQKMKMDGSASGKSWRDFARECRSRGLTRR